LLRREAALPKNEHFSNISLIPTPLLLHISLLHVILLTMRKLLVVALAFAFLPAAASAQQAASQQASSQTLRPPSLRLGGGAAVPVSDGLSFFHGAGPIVATGLHMPISGALDVTFDVGYSRLSLDEDRITRLLDVAAPVAGSGTLDFEVSGGANHLVSGTAGLTWTFATPGWAAFYLSGGTGLLYSSIGDVDIEARDAEGNPIESDGDARLRSSGEGASFVFDLGAGVRLPVAAGVDVFVEPRYALSMDSRYFTARAGVSMNNVFGPSPAVLGDAADREAPAPRRYEMSAGYRGTFFGDGDETGAGYRAEVARRLFSSRTGLALSGAYRRAVDTDMEEGLHWTKRRGVAADLTVFVDALRFETGRASHRLRIGAGPAVRRQWGEQPRVLATGADSLQVAAWREDTDNVHRVQVDGRTRYAFTNEFDDTQWGSTLKLEYVLSFDHITVGPSAGYWYYGEGSPATSYGVQIGVPFGKVFK
jgi:hypothetical protein